MTQLTSESFINWAALQHTPVTLEPFPYMVIPNFIKQDSLKALIQAFPSITHRGSIPAASVDNNPLFQQFVAELEGDALRQNIAEKFAVDLQNKPTMLTLRGQTTERDGKIHTDSKSKIITVLLYMNETWQQEGGQLRLLNNDHSLDDYVAEVPPLAGTCILFKVTPNCWHGHKPFVGKRLSLQLNYLTGEAALTKHLGHHRLTARLKRWFFQTSYDHDENY